MNPLPPLPLVDGDTLLIDNSSTESFTTCPRLSFYSIIRRLRPSGDRVPLTFGGIIHKILEARYRASTSLHAQTDEVTSVMLATAEREFAKWTPPEDEYRNFSCAVEFIRRYAAEYPFESFEVVKGQDGSPMIEVPFAIPFGELHVDDEYFILNTTTGEVAKRHLRTIRIVWSGRIDLAYISSNGGGLYVMDHKTTSIMGDSWRASFDLSQQLYGYAWAVSMLTGRQVEACVINGLGIRKPTKTGKAFEFQRPVIPVRPELLAEWKSDMIHILADFLEMYRRGYYPKHTVWCHAKFGECPFKKVCSLPTEEQREMMLDSGEFQRNDWSPLS